MNELAGVRGQRQANLLNLLLGMVELFIGNKLCGKESFILPAHEKARTSLNLLFMPHCPALMNELQKFPNGYLNC